MEKEGIRSADFDIQSEQDKALAQIFSILSESGSAELIGGFFSCLFTPSELRDIATRWLLVKEIDRGTTQREIARKLHISLCRITRGSRELKKEGSAFRKMLDMEKKDPTREG